MAENKDNKKSTRSQAKKRADSYAKKEVKKYGKKAVKKHTGAVVVTILLLIVLAVVFCALWAGGMFESFGLYFPQQEEATTRVVQPLTDTIEVHVIDIGQGDSILIKAPAGNVLVDAGPNSSEDELKEYLDGQQITAITYAVFTHMDEDHIGNADMVISEYKIENVLLPCQDATPANGKPNDYSRMMDAIEATTTSKTIVAPGQEYNVGGLKMDILGPISENYKSSNNYSVVMKVIYGATSMMLSGDAEKLAEKELLDAYPAEKLKCDVYKCGHHGSSSSTSAKFFEAVNPSIAFISCGVGNKYNHPNQQTLDTLNSAGIPYYRTDELGSLIFISDGAAYRFDRSTGK